MNTHQNLQQTTEISSPTSFPKYTTAFASKDQRFVYKNNQLPGPGAYDYKNNNFRTPTYHMKKDFDRQSPIKKQHQWILGSGRTPYLGGCNYFSNNLGPGAYQLGINFPIDKNDKGNWGKSQRFQYTNNQANSFPGPGSYQNPIKINKKQNKKIFKNKTPRTFIQKILSQPSQSHLRINQSEQVKKNPQIDSFDDQNSFKKIATQNTIKKIINNTSSFASKIKRFSIIQKSLSNIGPGSYDLQMQPYEKARQKLPKIIIVRKQHKYNKALKQNPESPGPGFYEPVGKTIQKSLLQKRKIVICNQPRFTEKYQSNPGPGHYMSNKNSLRVHIQKLQKYTGERASFNTSSDRTKPQLPTKQNPLCSYNLDYYDLQHRVKKHKQHIQKLKIMDVTVPAFNTKTKR